MRLQGLQVLVPPLSFFQVSCCSNPDPPVLIPSASTPGSLCYLSAFCHSLSQSSTLPPRAEARGRRRTHSSRILGQRQPQGHLQVGNSDHVKYGAADEPMPKGLSRVPRPNLRMWPRADREQSLLCQESTRNAI